MATVSGHIHGIIHVDFTPLDAMVTAVTNQATVQHVQEETGHRRCRLRTRGVLLLNDNSMPRTALWTPGIENMLVTHHAALP